MYKNRFWRRSIKSNDEDIDASRECSSYLKVRWNHLHCVEHVVKSFCAASIIWRIGGVFTLLPVHMHFYCIPHGHVGYRKHGLIHCNSDEKWEEAIWGVLHNLVRCRGRIVLRTEQWYGICVAWSENRSTCDLLCASWVGQRKWLTLFLWWSRSLTQSYLSCCYPRVQFAHG